MGWKWDSLMDVGLDIRIDLSKECFLGAVCIGLADGSAVQMVEVFSENKRNLQCIGRFDAQTDGLLKGEFTIPIGVKAKILVVRFKANLKDIVISKLDVIGAIPDLTTIYPSPASAKYTGEKIALESIQSIVTYDDSKILILLQDIVRERFYERFGISLPIGESGEKIISIGLCDDIKDRKGIRLLLTKMELGLLHQED